MSRIRLAVPLLLLLFLTACAPATRHKAAATSNSGKSTPTSSPVTPPQKAAPQTPNTPPATTAHPLHVVMGTPLPSETPPDPGQMATQAQPARSPQAPVPPAQPAPTPLPASETPPNSATPPAAGAPGQPSTTPPAGFGGLNWGASPKSIPGLAVYETDTSTGVATYVWPEGPKDIFGAPIRDTYYEFYQGRFYHVWIDFDGMAAYKAALAGLTRTYGPPTKEVPEKYYHAWTLGDVNIYCAFHPAENGGDVSFFYQPLYEPMIAAQKAAAQKAAGSHKP